MMLYQRNVSNQKPNLTRNVPLNRKDVFMRRLISALLAVVLLLSLVSLSGCSGEGGSQKEEFKLGDQLKMPEEGDEIAVITTNMGVIKIRFFPELAPKTVENFTTHAREGYYDGIIFHRVINDFMIQTGDPEGNGTGGESIWGGEFEDEFSTELVNIRGSVSMANRGPATNGSQFFINQSSSPANWDYVEQGYQVYLSAPEAFTMQYGSWVDMTKVTDEYKKIYDENGGNYGLDGAYSTAGRGHTVFAQVIEGMDVVDAIAAVQTNPETDRPIDAVRMLKIEIVEYHK